MDVKSIAIIKEKILLAETSHKGGSRRARGLCTSDVMIHGMITTVRWKTDA